MTYLRNAVLLQAHLYQDTQLPTMQQHQVLSSTSSLSTSTVFHLYCLPLVLSSTSTASKSITWNSTIFTVFQDLTTEYDLLCDLLGLVENNAMDTSDLMSSGASTSSAASIVPPPSHGGSSHGGSSSLLHWYTAEPRELVRAWAQHLALFTAKQVLPGRVSKGYCSLHPHTPSHTSHT